MQWKEQPSWNVPIIISIKKNIKASNLGAQGDTPLQGLNGDVRPNRVWLVLNGMSISPLFILNRGIFTWTNVF